jgi:hypothetical protein
MCYIFTRSSADLGGPPLPLSLADDPHDREAQQVDRDHGPEDAFIGAGGAVKSDDVSTAAARSGFRLGRG